MTAANALVLFDIDGTLMRGAGSHHKEALVEGVRRVTGRETSFDGIDTAGRLDLDLIGALLGEKVAQDTLRAIAVECQSAYIQRCSIDLRPFVLRGVRELLAALRDHGAAIGLVTGNLSAIGWRKMELAGLREFFHIGAFSEDGATRAQIASVAQRRAQEARLLKGERVSLIGDHRNDVEAAKANGMRAVAVASGVMQAEELRRYQPDILVESLADLAAEALVT